MTMTSKPCMPPFYFCRAKNSYNNFRDPKQSAKKLFGKTAQGHYKIHLYWGIFDGIYLLGAFNKSSCIIPWQMANEHHWLLYI